MIQVLVTGGTFDKAYDELNGKFHFKETQLPELFNYKDEWREYWLNWKS